MIAGKSVVLSKGQGSRIRIKLSRLISGRHAIYHRVPVERDGGAGSIESMSNRICCGVAVIATHQGRVLFGKRKTNQDFEWQLPGGWIETGEAPQQAARREVIEETGIELAKLNFVGVTNNIFSSDHQSISLYFEAQCVDAKKLRVNVKSHCFAWEWKPWKDIKKNLYLPLKLFKQTDYQPFSADICQVHTSI